MKINKKFHQTPQQHLLLKHSWGILIDFSLLLHSVQPSKLTNQRERGGEISYWESYLFKIEGYSNVSSLNEGEKSLGTLHRRWHGIISLHLLFLEFLCDRCIAHRHPQGLDLLWFSRVQCPSCEYTAEELRIWTAFKCAIQSKCVCVWYGTFVSSRLPLGEENAEFVCGFRGMSGSIK